MAEERVDEGLRALRRADSDVEPSRGAEVRALLAFRRRRRRRRMRRLSWAGGIAAVTAALFLAVHGPVASPAIAIAKLVPPPPSPPALQPAVKKTREPQEIVTPFYSLMPSQPPLERGVLVRVTVEASALRSVGIPVAQEHLSDPVLADVLVGQDDLARAIRFVSYQ